MVIFLPRILPQQHVSRAVLTYGRFEVVRTEKQHESGVWTQCLINFSNKYHTISLITYNSYNSPDFDA